MAESAFSAIKHRYGSAVEPSTWYHEFREMVLTVTIYYLEKPLECDPDVFRGTNNAVRSEFYHLTPQFSIDTGL